MIIARQISKIICKKILTNNLVVKTKAIGRVIYDSQIILLKMSRIILMLMLSFGITNHLTGINSWRIIIRIYLVINSIDKVRKQL